ncbi:hypothetical protein [Methyloterricola oryzae]|uniref:hypothetical protein n=1 Tax=Methyloterricola oryzae TaxID=1495050 RepID=UPI00069B21A8|nr:hypothetical protein [Methyloterricola oryzae]
MKALFICGSLNQTRMMYQISLHLPQFHANFTPYFCDGPGRLVQRTGALDFTVLGGEFHRQTAKFLTECGVNFDFEDVNGPYDLVLTCIDLIVPKRIRNSRLVLVQEGMTDPETPAYHLVRAPRLPRWLAQTSAKGLSNAYDLFRVASEGYRSLFERKGVRPEKIRVTGIPTFDHCAAYLDNDVPHRDHVLVATSDMRETFKFENRPKFIEKARRIAAGAEADAKIPSDCPLIDPDVIDQVLDRVMQSDCDYVSNLHLASWPDGNDVEVMRLDALETAWREAMLPMEREHTPPYLWERPERFKLANVRWDEEAAVTRDGSLSHRWTLDYAEDCAFIRQVFETLYPENPVFGVEDILDLLASRPQLADINERYLGVNWYRHHLHQLKTVDSRDTAHLSSLKV